MALDQMEEDGAKEMSFIDHLEELRWHVIRGVIAVFVVTIAAFVAKDFVIGTVIMGPSKGDFWTYRMLCELSKFINIPSLCIQELPFELISRTLSGQFMTHISVSFAVGLIIGFPYLFWEIWRFIKPGLYSKERKVSRGVTFFVSVLFMTGILFGYFIVAPISVYFFSSYVVYDGLKNMFDLSSYISMMTMLVFGSGVLFQLPMVVYFLAKIGLISSTWMKKYRKHSIIVILVVAAIVTPPDPFTQMLVALPLMLLYQMSIVVVKRVERRKEKARRKEEVNKN